jgi:phosphoribosylaminoimidazole-succinocarboxamide synthase
VREVYEVDAKHLLLVASDRVSAFDVVLDQPIPRKGAVLTQLSAFWFEKLKDVIPSHYVTASTQEIIERLPQLADYRDQLAGRGMLALRAQPVPFECVIRGYITGSAWAEYREKGTLAGEPLAPGLKESGRLNPPIFSPATKAEEGHDINVTFETVAAELGLDIATRLRDASFKVYTSGRDHAARLGIIIADTKFEFGFDAAGTLRLIDEVLTPGFLAFLAGRSLPGGWSSAQLRQATAARLPGRPQEGGPLERRGARTRAAGRGGRGHQLALPRRVSPHHWAPPGGGGVIRTAPEGRWFIFVALLVLAVLLVTKLWWWALFWFPLTVWVIAFFRDPARDGPRGDTLVVAPADGKVVSVIQLVEPAFHQAETSRVSIFMNVFDCHVNRYPVSGRIGYRHYNPGRFLNAADEKASLENEQASIGLLNPHGKVLVRQIAGLIARRIVTDHQEGQEVMQGDRMGMIRFGSRVDVFLPPNARVLVKEGERTIAGMTVIAEWT